jgi:hypothetical protein
MKVQKTAKAFTKQPAPPKDSRLPTPATSSTTSWSNSSSSFSSSSPTWNDTFLCPTSEIDELDGLLVKLKTMSRASKRTRRSLRTTRPQMIQSTAIPRIIRNSSSWPFTLNDPRKSITADTFITGLVEFYHQRRKALDAEPIESLESLRLALTRQFPYAKAFNKIISTKRKNLILQDETVDKIMNDVACIYAGSTLFDLQKQTEIVFCAWTTLLQYACTKRILRDEQLPVLALAATVLQAKLMDEADVNIGELLKKTGLKETFEVEDVKVWERRISTALQFKILYPTPQVLLFLFFDNLDSFISVPLTTKLVCGLVLDNLMQSGAFRQMILDSPDRFSRIGLLVLGVMFEVLAYFYIERSLGSLSRRHLLSVLLETLDARIRVLLFWPSFDFRRPEDILTPVQAQILHHAITEVRSVALGGQCCNFI